VIGTVTALNQQDQRMFTQHDVNLLMSLAAQAAAAIEGAHLYHAEQERRQVAETLVQAGRHLTSTLQLREVPSHILEQLKLVLPFERASLILQEGESLRIVAQHGFPDRERTRQLTISIREGDVYQQVVAAGSPVLVGDVTRTAGWSQVDWLPLNLSWMGVPLFAKERVIGMLSASSACSHSPARKPTPSTRTMSSWQPPLPCRQPLPWRTPPCTMRSPASMSSWSRWSTSARRN